MTNKMHLTCPDCGTVRNEPFCPVCVKPNLIDAAEERNRSEAIAKFVESIGGYVERDVEVYDSKSPYGFRIEKQRGLPNSHRCEPAWAENALRFKAFDPDLNGTGPSLRAVDEGVLPPNLDPLADV